MKTKGQEILNRICDNFNVSRVELIITNNPMLMRKDLGQYHRSLKQIRMKGNLSNESFMEVLVHEVCHHLDYEYFKMEESLHTKEFFERVNQLLTEINRLNLHNSK